MKAGIPNFFITLYQENHLAQGMEGNFFCPAPVILFCERRPVFPKHKKFGIIDNAIHGGWGSIHGLNPIALSGMPLFLLDPPPRLISH